MLPDIQNFSDLTVIDTSDLLDLQLEIKQHGNIEYLFTINNEPVTGQLFKKRYPINTQFTFECMLIDFVENSGAIEIISITINSKQVLPLYQHLGTPPTAYIDFSIPWKFEMDRQFYPWYHEISGQGWIA